jgi:TPR repeat protein
MINIIMRLIFIRDEEAIFMRSIYWVLLSVFALLATATYAGDFDKGLAAYEAGNYATAFEEFSELAEEGLAEAQFNLGLMHEYGEGTTQDNAAAVEWYTLAAEQGYIDAQYNVGVMYEYGKGVLQDYAMAAEWYTLAAEQGYASAQLNLGLLYFNGLEGTENYNQAAKYFTLAAEQGKASAQLNLGVLYGSGLGVIQDYTLAHMWGNIAAANGADNGATLREFAADSLTQADITAAQALARECMASNYENCGY